LGARPTVYVEILADKKVRGIKLKPALPYVAVLLLLARATSRPAGPSRGSGTFLVAGKLLVGRQHGSDASPGRAPVARFRRRLSWCHGRGNVRVIAPIAVRCACRPPAGYVDRSHQPTRGSEPPPTHALRLSERPRIRHPMQVAHVAARMRKFATMAIMICRILADTFATDRFFDFLFTPVLRLTYAK